MRLAGAAAAATIAFVTMAFAASTPDRSEPDMVVAGGGAAVAVAVVGDVTDPGEPSAPTPGRGRLDAAHALRAGVPAGADEAVASTDDGRVVLNGGPVVPADYVPGFVTTDLTDQGAHVSATPPPSLAAPLPASEPDPQPQATTAPAPATSTPQPVAPTPAPPTATPAPTATPLPAATDDSGSRPGRNEAPSAADWAALRACESGGSYTIDSGNGYFGAYQFSQATWDWVASMARPALVGVVPSDASPGGQDAMALALYGLRGAAPWPSCGVHLT